MNPRAALFWVGFVNLILGDTLLMFVSTTLWEARMGGIGLAVGVGLLVHYGRVVGP